jgi:hypothetical protein
MTAPEATELLPRGTSSVTCTVEDCAKPHKAHGLCATHYARWRRTGSADTTRKPGPKPDAHRAMWRGQFEEWGDRKFARFWFAFNALQVFGGGAESAILAATRDNGTLNIAAVERMAYQAIWRYVRELPDEPEAEA